MTIQYKSASFNLTSTNATTVLSITTSAIAIVKTVQAVHDSASNVDTHLILKKSGESDFKIGYAELNKATANEITGVVSYALIDRSQQNG